MESRKHIELDRSFTVLQEQEIDDEKVWEGTSRYRKGFGNFTTWKDLQNRYRTVILGEAGSGKTQELKYQSKTLKAKGIYSFFVPIEELQSADEVLEYALDPDDYKLFEEWKKSAAREAIFFLDSVDELKLKGGSFKKALSNLKKEVGTDSSQLKLIISCRPSDWDQIEISEPQKIFPSPQVTEKDIKESLNSSQSMGLSKEELFLEPLRRGNASVENASAI